MLQTVIERLPIGWAGRLALQRLFSQWRSLLTIIAGTLLGASVGALVPLYTTAVSQVSMVERVNQQPPRDVNLSTSLLLIPAQDNSFQQTAEQYGTQIKAIVQQHIGQAFPGWVQRVVPYAESAVLDVNPPAEIDPNGETRIPKPTTRLTVAYYEGWTEAVSLVAGRLPADTPEGTGADIEVVIPFAAQNELGVQIGDVLDLDQGGPRGGWPSSKIVRARIAGVVAQPEPLTIQQRPYFMEPSPIRLTGKSGDYEAEYAVLTTQASLFRVSTQFVPETPTRFGWRFLFDHTRLPFSSSPQARWALFDMQSALAAALATKAQAALNFTAYTKLIDWTTQGGVNVDQGIMLAYERSVRSLDAPFGLLLLQVGALVIFFLMVTAALVRRGERREISMLQSRGAMDRSIVLVRGIEALAICAIAALVAPVLSQQLLIWITPFFAQYENLPLVLTSTDFIYAAVAAAVAFIALMFTLRPVLRLPLISSGGAAQRSEKRPWWQRYYVDVLLVVLGIAALWRLVGRDTPLFTTTTGGRTTDPFLLLAPALLFLGLGSLLLRLFPTLAGFAARALAAGRGLVAPMASWQLSREPIHYGRITFLLALAIGIGWFATSFRATVSRSQTDQARYRVGTSIRTQERDVRLNVQRARPDTAYTAIPGIEAASVAWRTTGINFQGDVRQNPVYGNLLAVDSDTFGRVPYWRDDLGTIGTPRAPGSPIALPERGEVLPFVPIRMNLWANFATRAAFGEFSPDLDRLRNRTRIFARLLDATGTWVRVPFTVAEVEYISTGKQSPGVGGGGTYSTSGWAYLEADLTQLTHQPVAPVRLVSLYWEHRGRAQLGESDLLLTLAGLTGTPANAPAEKRSLNLLTDKPWEFVWDSGALAEGQYIDVFPDVRRGAGMTIRWSQQAAFSRMGMVLNYPDLGELPALVSESLAGRLSILPGQSLELRGIGGRTVKFKVTGAQKYYPSLYDSFLQDNRWIDDERHKPFVITDRDALIYTLNHRPSAVLYPDEVWVKTTPGADITSVAAALRPADRNASLLNTQTLPGELANLQTDPLSLGLLGLMLLAFIIAIALSIVGLLTYATLTANARRSEFGVLQALGLSSWQVIGQLAFEQIFVVVLGTALGALLGVVLSSQVVPRLALDTASRTITPPFVMQVEYAALAQYGLLIAAVLAAVLLFSLLLVRNLSLSRTLRLGDE